MRKQDQLNALIAGMTKQEKRYFKLFALSGTGNKQFIRLFDELANTPTYEPDTLAKKLKVSKRNLVDIKAYLQEVLLRSLSLYHKDKDPTLKLYEQWEMAKVLYKRKLHQMACDLNERVVNKAQAFENFQLLHLALQSKYNILLSLDMHRQGDEVLEQINLVIKQLDEIQQLMMLLTGFGRNVEGKESGINKKMLAKQKVFNIAPHGLHSNSARVLWLEARKYYCNYIVYDYNATFKYVEDSLQIFEKHPQLINTLLNPYLGNLFYLGNNYAELGKYDQALHFAERLEYETEVQLSKGPSVVCSLHNLHARVTKLTIYCFMNRFDEAAKLGAALYRLPAELRDYTMVIVSHHYALALFYLGKYDKALKVCNDLQTANPEAMKEVQLSNKLLMVMLQHAQQNYSMLPYLLNSAATWAKRHDIQKKGAREILQWMRRFLKAIDSNQQPTFFNDLKAAAHKGIFGDYARELGLGNWVLAQQQQGRAK